MNISDWSSAETNFKELDYCQSESKSKVESIKLKNCYVNPPNRYDIVIVVG